jgi:hypothetical protein
MADKISKFKQALRAQRTLPSETSAFEKEIQKYKHTKEQQPAKGSSPKKEQKPERKSADTHSNTASNTKRYGDLLHVNAPDSYEV